MNSNKKTVVSCFGDLMKQLAVHYQFDAARGKETVLANKYRLLRVSPVQIPPNG